MLAEEIRSDLFPGRFTRQRFDPVLAKFKDMPVVIRTGPGAALTIEAILFVDL